jgi:zinc transport system ATP-binding protein
MSQPILIKVQDISLKSGSHQVLSHVSLSVQAGQIVTVVGPNGAGKSSLLKVALGLKSAQSGTIWRAAPCIIGYVPQRLSIDATLPLTVQRFMAMAGRSIPASDCLRALQRTGAAELLHRQVRHLSGGELQRTLLARALVRRPHLLALDEPAAGVDVAGQAELYDLIASLARQDGCGVLLISHDLHVVMAATDEVICLNGHVCCAGHPEAVSRHPEYLSLFGPRAAASLAVYTHSHGPECHHG